MRNEIENAKNNNFQTIKISEKNLWELNDVYSEVFGGSPWFEKYRCADCGEHYSTEKDTKENIEMKKPYCTSKHCDGKNPLNLVEYYKGTYFDAEEGKTVSNLGEAIIKDALKQNGKLGLEGRIDGRLVGFSWGYELPSERSPSVWFDIVTPMIKERGFENKKIFYAAEVGVLTEHRSKGYGTKLIYDRLVDAKNSGYEYVTLRTKNQKLLDVYSNIFESRTDLFRDPDLRKDENDKWYIWNFKDFKG